MKWWIKADGCDLVKGLFESTKGEWSGDVDLNSGNVLRLFIQNVGLGSNVEMKRDLETIVRIHVYVAFTSCMSGLLLYNLKKLNWSMRRSYSHIPMLNQQCLGYAGI